MPNSENSLFTEAVAAVRAGEHGRARGLLTRLLRTDSSNPEYWLWLSAVAASDRERESCLKSVLRHDPTNRAALRGLSLLGARTPDSSELASALHLPRRKTTPTPFPSPVLGRIAANPVLLAGALLAAVAIFLATWNIFRPRPHGVAPTLPTPSATPTATPATTPTHTPISPESLLQNTPIPPELSGTPLAAFTGFQPTPTPLIGITPHPMYGAYQSAIDAFRKGNLADSIQFMDQVIAMDPDLADPHYFRGEAFRLQGEISESKLAFEQAILLDPTFAPAYLGLARIQLWEDPNTLPDALEQALSHDPTFLQAHLEKADHLARMNAWEQLEESARHALDAGVRTPLLSIRLGQAQFHLGKFQEALDRLLTGIIGDPNILESYLLLGQTLSELTRYEEAARPLQTYLTYRNQDPVGWAALGRAFYELGEYQRSLEAMNQALVWDAENPQYLLTRALINLQLSQPQDALTDLEQAVQLGLETEKIDLAFSWAYYQLEAFDQAITRLTNLIDTSESPQILSDALQLRAKVYEQLSPPQLAEALADWRMILELEEVSPDIQASAELAIQRLSKIVVEGTSTPPVEAPDLSPSPPP